ncbi:PREDICTED: somatomedin-B and thrombospondin type-1 domain-containing protein-like [Ceratosolen solmsi marchali]|uniref:Somatomedin-B and thrombospondin type-1 domain-containing protein-like n=1 Tax=Ceratosolen solmsi marchali TaxID=326594 RepID=A0AAJ6VL87_9HYME|nr:PREDICTED: somatomedin-B and thrombospondin type-1 domain-containing protein-like [Ceratosolen solmsi marchali]
MRGMAETVVLAMAIAARLLQPSAAGSCRSAKLCCQGRDSGCVIQKPSPNAIIESPRDKPCYCDHACLKLGDCCDDFNETCTASDCTVSDWSEWSECNNKCGLGHQTRNRFIVRPNRNGGKACPETEQSMTCQNYDSCRRRARHFQVEEINLSPSQRSETTLDSNFFPQVFRGYCTAFTILKISKGCRRRLESFYEGSRVCAWCKENGEQSPVPSCQSPGPSFAGIGRWELLNSSDLKHCHGKWMAEPYERTRENCSASLCQDRPILVFV